MTHRRVLFNFLNILTMGLFVHCKDSLPKNRNKLTRNETARPRSQFLHPCFNERFTYSHDRSASSTEGKWVDRSWEYINRSEIHECRNGTILFWEYKIRIFFAEWLIPCGCDCVSRQWFSQLLMTGGRYPWLMTRNFLTQDRRCSNVRQGRLRVVSPMYWRRPDPRIFHVVS